MPPVSRALWRSVDEPAAGSDGHGPHDAHPLEFSPSRRDFMRLAAASLALAGAGCSPPAEEITPYVKSDGEPVPGVPRYFATAMSLGGAAIGVLARSDMGRPTKIEGNPTHPSSLGATDVWAQAAVLELWDPRRSQTVRRGALPMSREAFFSALGARLERLRARGGEGLRVLTRYVDSPTLEAQLRAVRERFPAARRHVWEPLHRDNSVEGARLAFSRVLEPVYRFDRADVVVALDADFLREGPGRVRYARDFASRRRADGRAGAMSRVYTIESRPTLAGAMADHRIALPVAGIERWLAQLDGQLRGAESDDPRVRAAAADLAASAGRALIVAGESLPPGAHALVHALNDALGAPGQTLQYIAPVAAAESCTASLRELAGDMRAGRVDTLLVLGGNPVYDAPADLAFGDALARVPFSAHLALRRDETSAAATWHVPATHFLEHWSDARAHDGTASVVQPLIAPLYGGTSPHALLAAMAGEPEADGHRRVRRTWTLRQAQGEREFENFWRDSLREGVVRGSAAAPVSARPRGVHYSPPAGPAGWSVRFVEDASVRDGEFAANAWLQELPRPDSKLTWDNAALLAPGSAAVLGVRTGDLVEIEAGAARVRAPVWVLPGQAEGAIAIALGYGRGIGVDAYPLRASGSPWEVRDAHVRRSGGRHAFATTQEHARMEGRDPVRRAAIADFEAGDFDLGKEQPEESLYPEWRYEGYRWGMAIDLGACIGCNACTIACQAENNIPTVGKDQVARGREMHWIRVDRYYEGDAAAPRTLFQPVPCMQCENAPCEEVCPVGATVHDSEGINVQVYNRCVGTRFCSNNCPYKVRRFNFLQFADRESESLKAMRNPEVTVRMRGVMEKCNYCLQRITRARIETEREGRRIADGEVVTACQAACPTEAIVFGDLNDPKSRVVAAKRSPLEYALLGELNTRPRTTYLARLFNPNPDIEEG